MDNDTRITNPSAISGADLCRAALAEAAATQEQRAAARAEQLRAEIQAQRAKIAEALTELLSLRPPPAPIQAELFTEYAEEWE